MVVGFGFEKFENIIIQINYAKARQRRRGGRPKLGDAPTFRCIFIFSLSFTPESEPGQPVSDSNGSTLNHLVCKQMYLFHM